MTRGALYSMFAAGIFATAGAIVAAQISCSKSAAPVVNRESPPTVVAPTAPVVPPPSEPAIMTDHQLPPAGLAPATSAITIASMRVGNIELGQPMPAALTGDDLASHYVAEYIADGQAIDGFRFDDPPLTVTIAGGPFAELDRKGHHGPPPVEQLRAKAAQVARGGAHVTSVMIHGPGPMTAAGVGVGADVAALKAAYPDLRLIPRPPTKGDADLCLARITSMPGVGFVFSNCNAANAGQKSTRVDLWIPET